VGNVGVGRVGQEALQETVAGPVFRRPSEDHLLRGYAQQPGKQQHHSRHVQPVFRHERLEKYNIKLVFVYVIKMAVVGACLLLVFDLIIDDTHDDVIHTRTYIDVPNIIYYMHRRAQSLIAAGYAAAKMCAPKT